MKTQTLFITTIMLYFLIGTIPTIATATLFSNEQINKLQKDTNELSQSPNTQTGIWASVTSVALKAFDYTLGDPITMALSFWGILWDGVNVFHNPLGNETVPIIQIIGYMFVLFRMVLATTVGIELYMLIKNRKVT